ncbi:6182_t:CDS:2, partial [Racocetra persica]
EYESVGSSDRKYEFDYSMEEEHKPNYPNDLLEETLLIDKSLESHKWVFLKIIEATKTQPK